MKQIAWDKPATGCKDETRPGNRSIDANMIVCRFDAAVAKQIHRRAVKAGTSFAEQVRQLVDKGLSPPTVNGRR